MFIYLVHAHAFQTDYIVNRIILSSLYTQFCGFSNFTL